MLLLLNAFLLLVLLFLVWVVVVYVYGVEIVCFPVLFRCLYSFYLLVNSFLMVVEVNVAVSDYVEVAHSKLVRLLHLLLLFMLRRAFFGRIEVVLLKRHVADDVVVNHRFGSSLLVTDRVLLNREILMRLKPCNINEECMTCL